MAKLYETSMGAETRGDGGIYPPNSLTVYPPIIWVWPTSASPNNWTKVCIWALDDVWTFFGLHVISGTNISGEDLFLFLLFTKIRGQKLFNFRWRSFFWSSLDLPRMLNLFHIWFTWKKSWSRFIPQMLKMGQNWGKIANYPPQCSTKIDPVETRENILIIF